MQPFASPVFSLRYTLNKYKNRSQPLEVRIRLDQPTGYWLHDQLLNSKDDNAESQARPEYNPSHLHVWHKIVGVKLSPGRIAHQYQNMVVRQGEDYYDHEGQVGQKILSPRLGDVEGYHSDDIKIITEEE